LLGILIAAAFAYPASAQQTCSKLAAECVAHNKVNSRSDPQGARCAGYKAQCMATGKWVDRNRSFDNVTRK
jgi:hypothetical protein